MSESQWSSAGFRIQPFGLGRNAIQSKHANDLVDALNILGRITIVRGTTDAVMYADNGVTIQLAPEGDGGFASAYIANCYRVKSAGDEYLVCRTWNGTTEGEADVYVAKPFDARQPAIEAIAGVTHSYTYTSGPDALNDYRESNNGTTTEDQVVVPYWRPDCLIKVDRINYSGVDDPDENDIKLIEVSSRCWSKIV